MMAYFSNIKVLKLISLFFKLKYSLIITSYKLIVTNFDKFIIDLRIRIIENKNKMIPVVDPDCGTKALQRNHYIVMGQM
jgi:hypothetical protein